LRESGAIEQDADIVLMLNESENGDSEIIVAKHRGGARGIVRTTFDRPKLWFSDAVPYIGSL